VQLGVTIDGVPINDAGNFAVYPQEMTDPENLQEIVVTPGSSETDAPHVGAVGGAIGMITTLPAEQARLRVQQTFGSNNARKTFIRADSGTLADGLLKSFISYSVAEADKWKGSGQAEREHVDFKSVLKLSPGNTLTAGLLWNRMDNHNLRSLTLAEIDSFGRTADFGTATPQHLTPVNGTAQRDSSPANLYYNFNKNLFENSIVSLKGNFQLSPALRLDVEPYYWYGYGYGGGQLRTLGESNGSHQFRGGIRDINRDGDTLDAQMVYSTGIIKTTRPGITLRLNAQLDNHRLMTGYWVDRARERRTNPAAAFDNGGTVVDPWMKDSSHYLLRQDGTAYQSRDWLTVSTSQSLFLQDNIALLDDRLNLQLGLRRSRIVRDFSNYANDTKAGAADYTMRGDFAKTLPNLSARYQLDRAQQLFFNVGENFSAPAASIYGNALTGGSFVNGVLTGYSIKPVNVSAETSTHWDFGYRYSGEAFSASGSLFYIDYRNRIAAAYDPATGLADSNYNVGRSTTRGIELESSWRFQPNWSLYGSLSYTRSRLNDNLQIGADTFEPTAGQQFPDTPNWLAGLALHYRQGPWSGNLSAKYTGSRYSTLVNDEAIGGFTLVNFDASYRLPPTAFFRKPVLRLNVYNLLNTDYLMLNAGSGASFTPRAQGVGGSAPAYFVGAPRTIGLMIASDF
jgi:iron complex outermembrane receptor protein